MSTEYCYSNEVFATTKRLGASAQAFGGVEMEGFFEFGFSVNSAGQNRFIWLAYAKMKTFTKTPI
jgi:hypothetical protein